MSIGRGLIETVRFRQRFEGGEGYLGRKSPPGNSQCKGPVAEVLRSCSQKRSVWLGQSKGEQQEMVMWGLPGHDEDLGFYSEGLMELPERSISRRLNALQGTLRELCWGHTVRRKTRIQGDPGNVYPQGWANVFWKGPESKHFSLCGLCGLSHHSSALPGQHKVSHTQCVHLGVLACQ